MGSETRLLLPAHHIISFNYCYFRLPETLGRLYGELDSLFASSLPPRNPSKKVVAQFEDVQMNVLGIGRELEVDTQHLP